MVNKLFFAGVVPAILFLVFSCSPVSKHSLNRTFRETEARFRDHTGFMLYDPQTQKSIFEYNSATYFTPASNTKIFTFYTALSIIRDSIPAFRYVERGDSLIFWGTADPSLLYDEVYSTDRVTSFLGSTQKSLYFASGNYQTSHFGNGWAWDDYNDYYSAERSSLPVYGNLIHLIASPSAIDVMPEYYKKFISYSTLPDNQRALRNPYSNIINVHVPVIQNFETHIPARMDNDLVAHLLSDTLKRTVTLVDKQLPDNAATFYASPSDSIYKVMMQESDNFIAEQLLLVCAGILSDTLKPEIAIKYMKQNGLKDLADEPIWIDGSGLSRYNLFTPRSIVQLWEKLYKMVPSKRLFPLLAIGGKAGTIRNLYKAEPPYIFGKTGSLSNNHCLSGYLVTRKGKTLIFSFMNSNFAGPTSEVRNNMQIILRRIYENF
ncbi:MAG: D-alanyl-D-alanine carboxypeptidase [Chryseolinea sp.]